MSLAAATRNEARMRERRCIVTGETREEARLIRFVVGPQDEIVPDLSATLPGRGIWVSADAIAKAPFAKAARRKVKVPADLAETVERLIVKRMQDDLGLAKRSGQLVSGFDSVAEMAGRAAVLVEASDGAPDGRRKMLAAARAKGTAPQVIDCLTSEEIGVALGRENVIHAALKSGQLAQRLVFEAGRLCALSKDRVGPTPTHEGHAKGLV